MKNLARGYCWWPNITKDIEEIAKNCAECNMYKNNPAEVEKHTWKQPKSPFERVHVDFAGPFLGKMFFILVDAYSKWPEVHIVENITTETTIKKCKQIFAYFGLPKLIITDNGRTFVAKEFKDILAKNGIVHKTTAPYNPSTNGQAERYVQIIKGALKKLSPERSEMESSLLSILTSYRGIPHTITGKTPYELMFNRKVRTKLDLLRPTTPTRR
ncbi:uncharacterized protein K02A2.6-like, partial [Ceratina calcarata]|uniref:RNA-directed DNA polymerase n=1 Tax=Ceratina calcarata TaxID=156304 RepID=A0AAJ7J7J9_9HYME